VSDQRDGGIAWTEQTWNPIRGCSRVSEGCRNCYAERQAGRMAGPGGAYEGLVKLTPSGPRWTGRLSLVEEKLAEPLRWTRPRMIFVNSMSDLFHEALTNEEIAAVFGVMAAAPRHTFQVLTKRAKRMREWFAWAEKFVIGTDGGTGPLAALWEALASTPAHLPSPLEVDDEGCALAKAIGDEWPLPNVWIGVSVEDQASADERIPHLLETPAAVRWVSYEPAIGPANFTPWLDRSCCGYPVGGYDQPPECCGQPNPPLDWIVVGGESGPGARPFDLEWARSAIAAGKAAGVPIFVKQLGAMPGHVEDGHQWLVTSLHDKKGGDMAEWPADLRVREWPKTSEARS